MKRLIQFAVAACLSVFMLTGCSKTSADEVLLYSVINDEETQALCDLFTENTGIAVRFLRASSGELVNRVIAESSRPQADILLGGSSSFHIDAAEKGALASYFSPAAENFPEFAKSSDGTWHGICVLALGIGVNEKRFSEKLGAAAEIPATWDDLLNPAFADEIVMTDPAASSTAYLFVQNQLQRLGWDSGWEYLSKLSELVGQFPSSGGAPPKLTGTGEYAVCIAYIHALSKFQRQGFPVRIIAPPQSAGEIDAVSILKGCPNEKNARKFVDFMLSVPAQELFAEMSCSVPVNPDAAPPSAGIDISGIDLIDYNAALAGKQRDEVLKRWQNLVK